MKKARFAMIFHCYQPVFNSDEEIEKAYKKAYFPLIETLKQFPGIKSSFHFSGNLLEWLEQKHPEYIAGLNDLISSGQIELLAGGYCEPILSVIPENDRRDQISLNKKIIQRLFKVPVKGVWVPERVWDPCLISTLSAENIKYTIVDDDHFTGAGLPEELVYGPCRVKRGSESLILFAGHSFLRYAIPFKDKSETMEYFKRAMESSVADDICFFFADDAEKFGAWPHTYKHIYEKGWLKAFFEEIENNNQWIETSTCSGILEKTYPQDIKCPPSSSYREMMRWCDGDFRNFFTKYPESGRMYGRMLSVSGEIEKARIYLDEKQYDIAKKELFKAQTNCAYWHGAFGGVYLPHLRKGVYEHLLKAQDILDRNLCENKISLKKTDKYQWKNNNETVLSNKFLSLYMNPDNGGKLCELDYKRQKLNLLNTIRRSRERYHRKLKFGYFSKIIKARAAARKGEETDIHDVLGISQPGLRKFLNYDHYGRESFQTHVFTPGDFWKGISKKRASDYGFLNGVYEASLATGRDCIRQTFCRRAEVYLPGEQIRDIKIIKEIEINDNPVVLFTQKLIDYSRQGLDIAMALEFNLMVWDKYFMASPRNIRADKFFLKDRYSGTELDFRFNRKFRISSYPIYSVNETEMGLCRTFQGISLVLGDDIYGRYDNNDEYVLHFSLTIR